MSSDSITDAKYMARAIELARRGRFTTSPNPNVGCVIVKHGEVVGEGWHQKAGEPHAEVHALAAAGLNAEGATCYVTLEPCSHYGRTPPCADALIKAKVARVVAAMVDPNPKVSGRGMQRIKDAGIAIQTGLLQAEAEKLNPGFIKRMKGQGPWVTVKLACSIDGKTALENGVSQWITSKDARGDVQQHRALSCAIISGADTVIADNASLNVRYDELTGAKSVIDEQQLRQPTRVIIDSQNRLTPDLKLFSIASHIILIRKTLDNRDDWPHFVEQVEVATNDAHIDLPSLMAFLAERQFNQVWIEAGATLAGAFIAENLVDELIIYQAPKLIGDKGRSLLNLPTLTHMTQVKRLSISAVTQVGCDIKMTAQFCADS